MPERQQVMDWRRGRDEWPSVKTEQVALGWPRRPDPSNRTSTLDQRRLIAPFDLGRADQRGTGRGIGVSDGICPAERAQSLLLGVAGVLPWRRRGPSWAPMGCRCPSKAPPCQLGWVWVFRRRVVGRDLRAAQLVRKPEHTRLRLGARTALSAPDPPSGRRLGWVSGRRDRPLPGRPGTDASVSDDVVRGVRRLRPPSGLGPLVGARGGHAFRPASPGDLGCDFVSESPGRRVRQHELEVRPPRICPDDERRTDDTQGSTSSSRLSEPCDARLPPRSGSSAHPGLTRLRKCSFSHR